MKRVDKTINWWWLLEDPAAFREMAEEGATPGGLNEQAMRELEEADFFSTLSNTCDHLLARMKG